MQMISCKAMTKKLQEISREKCNKYSETTKKVTEAELLEIKLCAANIIVKVRF